MVAKIFEDFEPPSKTFLAYAPVNICFYTIILVKTPLKSGTRVPYLNCHNVHFTVLLDPIKVFRLSKNNLLDNFSLIANQKWNFTSIFHGK